MPIGDPPRIATSGQQGWECPQCHATYAPWVAVCSECKPPRGSLRERLTDAQPTAPVFPAVPPVPYAPPVYPAPLFPAPLFPAPLTLTPEAHARLTMGAAAGVGSTYTITLNSGPENGEDDGAAGVPART